MARAEATRTLPSTSLKLCTRNRLMSIAASLTPTRIPLTTITSSSHTTKPGMLGCSSGVFVTLGSVVDCIVVECPTSYDAMDKETCEKYSEWEKWGTFASNEKALEGKDGKKYSPSIYGQGNTILIREWNAPARGVVTVPYNPIEEYPCNGAPAGDY